MLPSVVIVYKSYFGSAKKYATWLSQILEANVYTFEQISHETLSYYDIFVVISGTYMGKMPLVDFLEKNWKYLKGKEVIVIGVGMLAIKNPESVKAYVLIPPRIREKITFFKLPGRLLLPRLGPWGDPSKDLLQPIVERVNFLKKYSKNHSGAPGSLKY